LRDGKEGARGSGIDLKGGVSDGELGLKFKNWKIGDSGRIICRWGDCSLSSYDCRKRCEKYELHGDRILNLSCLLQLHSRAKKGSYIPLYITTAINGAS